MSEPIAAAEIIAAGNAIKASIRKRYLRFCSVESGDGTPKRTADYPSPPATSVIGSMDYPGMRYYVLRLHRDGGANVVAWLNTEGIIPGVCWKFISADEWAKITRRWVLVQPPAGQMAYVQTSDDPGVWPEGMRLLGAPVIIEE